MPEDRPVARARPDDRGRPGPPGPRPFRPGPRPDFGPPLVHTLRLREGEREIEMTGTAAFIRQMLDDIPGLLARLRGETPPRPAAIRMPSPPAVLDGVADDTPA